MLYDRYLNRKSMLFTNLWFDPVSTLSGGWPLTTSAWTWVKTSWCLITIREGPVDKADSLPTVVVTIEDINPLLSIIEVKSSTSYYYKKLEHTWCLCESILSGKDWNSTSLFLDGLLEVVWGGIEVKSVHDVVVGKRINTLNFWWPARSSYNDDCVGIFGSDHLNHWVGVVLDLSPVNTIRLITDFIEKVTFISVCPRDESPEVPFVVIASVIRISRCKGVPVDQDIYSNLFSPIDILSNLWLPIIRLIVISSLIDIHGDSDNVSSPFVSNSSEGLKSVTILEPLSQ